MSITSKLKQLSRKSPLFLAILLAGCSTNVVVKGSVPASLSPVMPVNAGLVLDEQLRNYTYKSDKGREISFAIGEAQTGMFSNIAKSMFRKVTVLDNIPDQAGEPDADSTAPGADLDLLVSPKVEEIQLATPFETKLKVFEVWIKYNLRVYAGDGEPIADWIMTAYGKTPTRFLKSDEDALNQAALVALRDAGARMTIEFPRVPEIKAWLANRSPALASGEALP